MVRIQLLLNWYWTVVYVVESAASWRQRDTVPIRVCLNSYLGERAHNHGPLGVSATYHR